MKIELELTKTQQKKLLAQLQGQSEPTVPEPPKPEPPKPEPPKPEPPKPEPEIDWYQKELTWEQQWYGKSFGDPYAGSYGRLSLQDPRIQGLIVVKANISTKPFDWQNPLVTFSQPSTGTGAMIYKFKDELSRWKPLKGYGDIRSNLKTIVSENDDITWDSWSCFPSSPRKQPAQPFAFIEGETYYWNWRSDRRGVEICWKFKFKAPPTYVSLGRTVGGPQELVIMRCR